VNLHADVLLTEMRYARICDKENEGVTVLSDAFKMCSWFLLRAYLKARRKARLQEKHSAYSQLPLSFLRDAVDFNASVDKRTISAQA
jgi:hypothetical protein